MKITPIVVLLALSSNCLAHVPDFSQTQMSPIYADLTLMRKAQIPVLFSDDNLNVGYAVATGAMQQRLSELAHQHGRCGNFEVLNEIPQNLNSVQKDFETMTTQKNKYLSYESSVRVKDIKLPPTNGIISALGELKSTNIRETVTWLSNYPTRYNKGPEANKHVVDFFEKLKTLVAGSAYPVTVDLITHRNTPQKSIRVSIKGSTRPQEHVVMGAHLDSIVGWGGSGRAPGADDNASGSSSLLEALRVLLLQAQPQRTVEFFWYAGEESGLLGSAEIAETYKTEKRSVIAVLQLDMTLFPGDGEFRITSINDFTSPWLRDYLKAINTSYLNVEILDDSCGYGCSDHASWNRRGYPTLFPTEAKFNSMFKKIHTVNDVITPEMSFEHALVFSKIAVVMGMDLANSTAREIQ
jgi:leucyl aminopeptidase